jgi:cytoskeletal protein CcmA (bactofilin family)
MKFWEKKSPPMSERTFRPVVPANPQVETPMPEPMPRTSGPHTSEPTRTVLGPSITLRGELTGDEDLVIEGQFDGKIQLRDHCLTVGAQGQVKAEIQASRVIVQGAVTGNITARERIEIRKTGRVLGDLLAPGISIEDGAYFKGSIEILREEGRPAASFPSLTSGEATEAKPHS